MSKKQEPVAEPNNVNLKHEMRKMYLMFRAFENGMKAAEKLEGLEQTIQLREKFLSEIDEKIADETKRIEKEKDKADKEIAAHIIAKDAELVAWLDNANRQKEAVEAEMKPVNDALLAVKKKEAEASARLKKLSDDYANLKDLYDELVRKIEETKSSLRALV